MSAEGNSKGPGVRHWRSLTTRIRRAPRVEWWWIAIYAVGFVACFAVIALKAGDLRVITPLSLLVAASCSLPAGLYYAFFDGGDIWVRPLVIVLLGVTVVLLVMHPIGLRG